MPTRAPSIGDDRDCDLCGTFVSALTTLYRAKLRPGVAPKRADPKLPIQHHFDWTFRDRPPSLPALARSARSGCRRCALLKSAISIPRGDSQFADKTGDVSLRFHCVANARMRAGAMPLKEVQELSISCAAPAGRKRADAKTCWGKIHVLRSDDFKPLSEDNVEMIRGAIDSCVDSHGSCPGREPMSRPLRLLNVMSGDRVRLEAERPRSRNPPVVYAALSYCWGASQAMKEARTTAGNLNERMAREGFSPASLPKTLRDAIAVTRLLGMQYLWIDALCIVQDCKAEWTSEAQRMMEYYGHARVTIVPVEAESADSGMRTGIMRPVSCRLSGLWSSDCGSDLVLCSKPPGNRKSSVSHSPWNRRGWTYQESLNSSRILFIFGQNATLECREGIWDTLVGWSPHKRQDWSRFLPFSKLTCPSLDRLDRDWAWLVQCYTERRLSNPRDKWFAFCGIADAFSRASGREIVAGLWRDRILEDIVSWRCRWKAPRKRARKSIPDLPRQDSLHNNPLTSPTPPPSCSHCGASEYASDPTNPANQAINLPSWTWLAAPWSDHAPGIPLSKTAITRFDPAKPHATILSVILPDNTVPTSPKLSLSTPAILPHASLLRVLSHARDNAPPATAEGPAPKDSGIAFLDDSFAEAMDLSYCSSCERGKHGARDCASYRILLEIQPPVEAILVGTAGFLQLGANGVGYRHFVLVQAVRGGGGGGHGGIEGAECREYRRVGTMHCVEGGRLGEVVEQELGGVEERRVVLV